MAYENNHYIMGKPLYRDDDEFTYTVQRVNNEDAEYINMLMLDRVDCIMGYANWLRIENSVRRYIDFYNEIGMKAPVNYEPLKKVNEKGKIPRKFFRKICPKREGAVVQFLPNTHF